MKVSIIGAGNVGALCASRILEHDLADVLLLDIQEDLAKAKALDLMDAGAILGYRAKVRATGDYTHLKDSKIVIVTAGFTRKPGMSRDELLEKNGKIIKEVVLKIKIYAPDSIIIMVTNPLDILTNLAWRVSEFLPSRVMGMAGILDGARFSVQIAQILNIESSEIESVVIGSHSNKMLILEQFSFYRGEPLVKLLNRDYLELAKQKTREQGSTIVGLLKGGSAFFAPSAGLLRMVESIIKDKKQIMPVCAYLDGEYGLKGVFLGTLAKIGKRGVEQIIELDLKKEERERLINSASEIKATLNKFN